MTANDVAAVLDVLTRGGALRGASPRGALGLARALASGRRDFYLGLEAHAVQRPRDPAVRDEVRALDWGSLDEEAAAFAGWMAERGVQRGDGVVALLANRVEFFVVAAACARLGAVPMPGSPASAPEQVKARLRETGARIAVVEPTLANAALSVLPADRVVVPAGLDGEPASVGVPWAQARGRPVRGPSLRTALRRGQAADGPDLVLFTSGTTGRSRGTRIAATRAGPLTAFRYLAAFGLDRDSVFFTSCPLYHAAPLVLSGLTLTIGGSVVVRRKLESPVDPLLEARATHAFFVPTQSERLARSAPGELDRLRRGPLRALLSGGAALRPALKQQLLQALGPVLYDFYGATELGIVSIAGPGDLACAPATVGRILPGVDVRLVDDDGREVPPGHPGLLEVRGASVSDGYLGEEVHGPERWHTAGDVCRLERGLLYVVDRKRDMILSGGVNLFPVDVEEALEKHPSVREAAAVGVPDPEWGEALHAFIRLEEGATFDPAALDRHCREHLARYAIPKALHVVAEIPRSPTGKVLRRELRDRLVQPVGPA